MQVRRVFDHFQYASPYLHTESDTGNTEAAKACHRKEGIKTVGVLTRNVTIKF